MSNTPEQPNSDPIQEAVAAAVAELRLPLEQQKVKSFVAITQLSAPDVVAELVLHVEDETANQDINELLAGATLPLPSNPHTLTP